MKRMYLRRESGVASTVGAMFALMIFTSLLSMFITQVVPVQMKGNEAQHDLKVISQFSYMRSMMDLLTLTKNSNYTAYVPIKLGAEGITLFASPTYGQLSVFPETTQSNFQLSISFSIDGGDKIYANSSGSIQILLPNKYYVAEVISYENGAIVRYNLDAKNSSFVIEPNIKFQYSEEGIIISAVLQVIYGERKSITGVETRNIGITYVGSSTSSYIPKSQVNITVRSNYTYGHLQLNFTKAWLDYLYNTLADSVSGTGYSLPSKPSEGDVTLSINNVARVDIEMVYFEVEIGT